MSAREAKRVTMMKKAMILALAAWGAGACAAGAAIAAPGTLAGSGTEGNPYVVYDYGTLVAFAEAVNGGQTNAWGVLAADITTTETKLKGDSTSQHERTEP